jgi:hypothetical protein
MALNLEVMREKTEVAMEAMMRAQAESEMSYDWRRRMKDHAKVIRNWKMGVEMKKGVIQIVVRFEQKRMGSFLSHLC